MKYYVYSHITKDTGKIFYIGKGRGNRAFSEDRSKLWKNVANKHGWKAVIICDDLTEDEAFEVEKFYIKEYGRIDLGTGNLVNLTDGGEGPSNPSIETRRKMSISHKGKVLSEEHIKKISLLHKGRKRSEETRKKISESAKRRVFSEETRQKMSESKKGKRRSAETLLKILEANKGRVSPLKGRKHSEESRKKMSDSAKRRCANKTNIIE